ncbi:hypothetical protein LLH06_16815 [Mucilaginibacter daejeonensis]|uniref:hypothetical protein n=1 Tax=Mucilaginibacter daejeonensis TaxID=398049 RepID=UPI001D17576F|nr:hypothetical protein [Mucilaginibacter daejeonensis]UEG52614.1 hypothetical protein LLH06_16815 [Mucilaginibacter daejeonensis]
MKRYLFTLSICLISFLAKAQLGYNYAQYDLGVSGALNYAYTDAETIKGTPAVHLHFTYNHTPFLNYIAEVQLGKLAGGDSVNTLSGRQFKNNYSAVSFRVQLQAGELINYENSMFFNALKNIYVSSGIGVIYNNMDEIHRNSLYIPDYTSTGRNNSSEAFIPIKLGYEFKIFNSYDEPAVKLDLGYQHNLILGDQLDGIKAGIHKDMYKQFVVTLKFGIGGYTSYRKSIRPN